MKKKNISWAHSFYTTSFPNIKVDYKIDPSQPKSSQNCGGILPKKGEGG